MENPPGTMMGNMPALRRRPDRSSRVPVWVSRLFYLASLLTLLGLMFPGTRWVRAVVHLFSIAVFPIEDGGPGLVIFLGLVGVSLMRRKRVGWWSAVAWLGLCWLLGAAIWVATLVAPRGGEDISRGIYLEMMSYGLMVLTSSLLLALLVACRRHFRARLRPGNIRRAGLVAVLGVGASLAIGYLLGLVTSHEGRPRSRLAAIVRRLLGDQAATALVPHWVQLLVGLLVALSLLAAVAVLLRSQTAQAVPSLDAELDLRALLADDPHDSLGYFATRRDKMLVFSPDRRAVIAYRVQLGTCLAAGDPVGVRESWPAAVDEYLETCHTFGWTPGVVGASEEGAAVYEQAGLRALRVGDEAVLDPQAFDLAARELRPVRASVSRLRNAGWTSRIRHHDEIGEDELARLIGLADQWRTGEDRGFSMALNRLGDPLDGRCVMVEALAPDPETGQERVMGLLSFVPWGLHGLSLDVMRRSPEAENGVTEFMVAGLMAAGRERGWRRVSMNFAVFRSALEEGERVGATALRRAQRRVLLVFSRWFQIEQLYRSNQKYLPRWQPRFLVYEDPADIGQVGAAMAVVEGFLDLPGLPDSWGERRQPLADAADPRVVAWLERPLAVLPAPRLPEQVRQRMATREAMLQQGIEPYPVHTGVEAPCSIVAQVDHTGQVATIGGRVMTMGDHGGVIFCRVEDRSARVQVLLDRERLGAESLRSFRSLVSLGDLVAFTGHVGQSRTGTPSLLVHSWRITSKSLRPLPDKRAGISDPEARVRHRALYLATSAEARDRLVARSRTIQAVRSTLLDEHFLEVETPILQTIHGGANARPFQTHINAYDLDLYLRIAPELYLKRLMVGGMERVFEIGRNFRNEGADATHNPEFTVVEAYQAHGDYRTMQQLTERMVRRAALEATGSTVVRGHGPDGTVREVDLAEPFRWVGVHEAISEGLGEQVGPDTSREELARHAGRLGIEVGRRHTRSDILEELYDELCESRTVEPTFYCDFPADLSPLTRPHRDDPRLAERWDLVVFGSELGTAYSELVDPVVQRQRLTDQSLRAAQGDPEAMEVDEDFLTALEHGMPPTGGLGIGLDRLVMLLTGGSIRGAIAFPLVRPGGGRRG